jgi:hypothetical protein
VSRPYLSLAVVGLGLGVELAAVDFALAAEAVGAGFSRALA